MKIMFPKISIEVEDTAQRWNICFAEVLDSTSSTSPSYIKPQQLFARDLLLVISNLNKYTIKIMKVKIIKIMFNISSGSRYHIHALLFAMLELCGMRCGARGEIEVKDKKFSIYLSNSKNNIST